jgi:hypothetical protein
MTSNSQNMNITDNFKKCSPLVRIPDEYYPTIHTRPVKTDKRRIKRQAKITKRDESVISLGTKPWVQQRCKHQHNTYRRHTKYNDDRSKAFGVLGDKESLSKNLECTSACNNVFRHGKCNRGDKCTYAHTLDKLKDPICLFNDNCRNPDSCRFKHDTETREDFYRRTNRTIPKLPATESDIEEFANSFKKSSHKSTPRSNPKNSNGRNSRDDRVDAPSYINIDNVVGKGEISYINIINEVLDEKEETGQHVSPVSIQTDDLDKGMGVKDDIGENVTILKVPQELAEKAKELAIQQGIVNFIIEIV